MLRHASIEDRCTVLNVGTDTGYGTAILCSRLGDHQVTAIDINPYLNTAAYERLKENGYKPRLITGNATDPLDWQGARIVATVSVHPIPPAWLAALKPGGRLVTTITGTSLILTADKQQDGSATGRIEHDRATFMHTRSTTDHPPRDPILFNRAQAEEGQHIGHGQHPVMDVMNAWGVSTMLELIAPGIEHRFITYDKSRDRTALMTHPDGFWARADERDGVVTIHQSGPRRLWTYLDLIRDYWLRHGELPIRGAKATITPTGTIELQHGRWKAIIDQ